MKGIYCTRTKQVQRDGVDFSNKSKIPSPHNSKFLRIQTKEVDFDIYILVLGIYSRAEMCHGSCAMKE